nr:putative ribonuclease H-like domain-containing protein [Tanacetum cinerariifolium]
MDNKKCIVNLEYLKEMLHICPRLPGDDHDDDEGDDQDDDDQDDNDDDQDTNNDDDDFVHPKEGQDAEDDDKGLYRDGNINLDGRDVQMTDFHTTQEYKDTHVTLTPVNPDGQQQSSSVKVQVSKILPKIEKTVNEQLEANVLTRSSNLSKTSYAVAADLSEMELKKILIEKIESNKSIQRFDEQRNIYKALVDDYESDKTILDTYGDTVTLKRHRDDAYKDEEPFVGSDRGYSRKHSTVDKRSSKASCTCSSFNELTDTPVDFLAFLMNRLKVDTLTPELLAGPTYELMKGSCESLVELQFFLKEFYKATRDQLDWNNPEGQRYPYNLLKPLPLIPNSRDRRDIPFDHFINNDLEYLRGGASSRKYTTFVTKTKAVDYGHIKWIEDLFYGFAVNKESARDVYSKRRIIAVTEFKEGDFKRLRNQDIKDMLLLLVQGKLTNLMVKERFAFNVSLRMFTKIIVIQRRVEDLQLGIRSYQKKLNLTKPDTYRSDLKCKEAYTVYSYLKGFIYQNKDKQNRLMRIDELHKFNDGMLNDVRIALDDRLKGIRMKYLPQVIWRKSDKERAATMIQAIDKQLKTMRIMRHLEKFVEPEGSTQGYPLASVEVLRYDKRSKSKNMIIVPTEMELILEHTQQDGNPIKEILLKLNLPDHRTLKDRGEVPPPHRGLFLPPKSDLSYTGLEELFNEPKTKKLKDKSNDVEPESIRKGSDAPIIKDWVLDDEEEKVKTVWVKKVNTAKPKAAVNATKEKAKHKAVKGKKGNAVKASACWTIKKLTRDMLTLEEILKERRLLAKPVVTQSNDFSGTKASNGARKEKEPERDYILLPLWTADSPFSTTSKSSQDNEFQPLNDGAKKVDEDLRKENKYNDQGEEDSTNSTNRVNTVTLNINVVSSSRVNTVGTNISIDLPYDLNTVGTNIRIDLPYDLNMPSLEDIGIFKDFHDDEDIFGVEADFYNLDFTFQVSRYKMDERGIVIRNKARLVAQGHTQEEGIDYDEVFSPVARIEAIRLFLTYASFKDFIVYQMDMKSVFLYGKIKEKVYVCQPPGFEDPDFPDKVYKVEKALYGLHQAPRAWYETLSTYILDNGFKRRHIHKTLFIKRNKGDILLVQVYVDDIIFGYTKKEMYIMFVVCACARYQVTPKVSHLHAVKRIFKYLKGQPKLGLWYPKNSPFDLVAYMDSDYAGASLDRKSTTGECQFLGCRLISWQCKKQTVVANSTTEA